MLKKHTQRVKQVSTTQGTIYYLNPGNSGDLLFEKQVKPDNSTELRSFVTAGGQVVAVIKQITTAANVTSEQTRYFLRDNLSSTNVVTDESGAVLEQLAYEPFGKRRQAAGPQDPNNTLSDPLGQRGFTNHEHLDELALIHMNGRVYDPMTARFMSADPYIQAPLNSQSYNRYSYGWNSPLNGTDPTGYDFFSDLFKNPGGTLEKTWHDVWNTPVLRTAVVVAAAYYTGDFVSGGDLSAGIASTQAAEGAAAGGFAGGFVGGNGSISDGLKGAVTATLFYQVGSTWAYKDGAAANIAGHAAVGCLSATMSGGQCGSGALAAGIADYASNDLPPVLKDANSVALNTAYVSIVGGTTSVIGGGKFANGAETAAFGYLFNCVAHECFAQGRDAERTFVSYLKSSGAIDESGLEFNRYSDGFGGYFLGRPDIFSRDLNMVWDVKPDSIYGFGSGAEQIARYTSVSGYEAGAAAPLFRGQSSIVLSGSMNRYEYSFGGNGLVIYRALDASPMERAIQQLFIIHSAARRDDQSPATAPLPMPGPIPVP